MPLKGDPFFFLTFPGKYIDGYEKGLGKENMVEAWFNGNGQVSLRGFLLGKDVQVPNV